MKIGFDAKRLFRNRTGLGNYSRSLVGNLQSYFPEHHYYLFAARGKDNGPGADFLNNPNFNIIPHQGLSKAYWRSYGIGRDINTQDIDLFHGLSNELPFSIKQTKAKSVVSIHDLIFKIYPETYSLTERYIYDIKFKFACQQADHIVAISENTKKDIIRFYGIKEDKISVIYQTCNPLFYQQQNREQVQKTVSAYNLPQDFFICVGTVEARKNLKLIIEAYRQAGNNLSIPLLVIGKGAHYKEECLALVKQYNLSEKFIFIDNLQDNHHLQALYQEAKAMIYPSLYEGFGIPIAEALLSDTPVIAANTSSLQEAGGPNCSYIDPNNPEELANAMIDILQLGKEARAERCTQGREYAENHFSAEQSSKAIMQLYSHLIL